LARTKNNLPKRLQRILTLFAPSCLLKKDNFYRLTKTLAKKG
jgi:hypothetical protein